LHAYPREFIFEYITVMTNKYEIALVMEGNHTTSTKLRILREQRSQQPPHLYTHLTVEVVENQLGTVVRGETMMANVFAQHNISDFKDSHTTINLSDYQLPPASIPHH
jgi:hypothetical protein